MIQSDNIKLTDLIDVQTLQEIQDGFANATGMAALTTDETGAAVTRGSNFTDFCMNLTRKSHLGCQRCEECDRKGGEDTMRTKRAVTYTCHAGLVDFAAPIMLNGRMIGSFIGGQVLTSPPDEAKLRRYASEIGVDPDEYIKAVKKVKVLPKQQVEGAAEFLFTIASVLSKTAYSSYMAMLNNSGLSSANTEIVSKAENAKVCVKENLDNMEKLHSEFDALQEVARNSVAKVASTMETVKVIQDIAMNTRILGFNAYIEAAHAKESGKGFGVITQEIRNLADTSKESADKIENAMKSISDFTKKIDTQIKETEKIINDCTSNIKNFSLLLNDILDIRPES